MAAKGGGSSSSSGNGNGRDVFPETWTVEVPSEPLRYPGKKEWTKLRNVAVFAYRLDQKEHLINFYRFRGGVPEEWVNENLRDNFKHTGKESTKFNRFEPQKLDFERLVNRFARPIRKTSGKDRDGRRFNTDVRVCYCWDDRHVFLVQAYFTFGQRTVEAGSVHLYRTTKAPILFYRLPTDTEIPLQTGRFHERDDVVYERFVLQPWSTYAVAESTTYMILTVQKTLFSVYVVPKRDDPGWQNPERHKTLLEENSKPTLHQVFEKKGKRQRETDEDDDDDEFYPSSIAKRNATEEQILPVQTSTTTTTTNPSDSLQRAFQPDDDESLSSSSSTDKRNASEEQIPLVQTSATTNESDWVERVLKECDLFDDQEPPGPSSEKRNASEEPVQASSTTNQSDLVERAFQQCDLSFDQEMFLMPVETVPPPPEESSPTAFLQELAEIPFLDDLATEEMILNQIVELQNQLIMIRRKRL